MTRWYGNISNRFEEDKIYNKDNLIHEGDDITMYLYTDRDCYYVTKVNNQKDIMVKQYKVTADKEKASGMGHQEWLYIKDEDVSEENWVYRYKKWMLKSVITIDSFNRAMESQRKAFKEGTPDEQVEKWIMFKLNITNDELNQLKNGKEIKKYYDLSGKVSIGVRDYYYDWEF